MRETVQSKLNPVFVSVPNNICSYNNLHCATVMFFLSNLFLLLALFQVPTFGFLCVWAWLAYSHSQLAVVWLQEGSRAGCTRRRLHSEIAHTAQYGHSSWWVRKTSRRTERGDRGREARRMWETWKYVRERESKAEPVKNAAVSFFFFIALLWQHVWNWNVIRC